MIERFSIENYRCFAQIDLRGLRRINIITGENGSGKTALLEALSIATKGQPGEVIRQNRLRGLPEPGFPNALAPFISTPMTPEAFRAIWASLFRDDQRPVSFKITPTQATAPLNELSLRVRWSDQETVGVAGPDQAITGLAAARSVVFERREGAGAPTSVEPILTPQGQMMVPALPDFGPRMFSFPATSFFSHYDAVVWFSNLSVKRRTAVILEAIRRDFPFITSLSVLSPAGAQGIYATLSDGTTQTLAMVSSGINKIFTLYCALSDLQSGVLLVDEIENGIYYEKYASVWRNLYDMCCLNQNQAFITSHSAECMEALVPLLDEAANDFCLLRAERQGDQCVIRQMTGEALHAGLRGAVEIRGTTHGTAQAHVGI